MVCCLLYGIGLTLLSTSYRPRIPVSRICFLYEKFASGVIIIARREPALPVLVWRIYRNFSVCTFDFVDDVMFSNNRSKGQNQRRRVCFVEFARWRHRLHFVVLAEYRDGEISFCLYFVRRRPHVPVAYFRSCNLVREYRLLSLLFRWLISISPTTTFDRTWHLHGLSDRDRDSTSTVHTRTELEYT